jgi:hypothetical protein
MPTGGGGAWSKQGAADYQGDMQTLTAITAIAGSMVLFAGWIVVGLALGAVALVAGLEVARMDDIIRDPPKPHDRLVTFHRRISRPPGKNDPVASRIGLVAQYGVTAMVTMQGLLDALERGESARLGGDIDWAVAHDSMARIAARTMAANLAYQAWAIAAAAEALEGTPQDVMIPAGDINPLQKFLGDPERVKQWRAAGLDSGLIDQEIDEAVARLRGIKPLVRAVRPSDGLAAVGRTLYATAFNR